MTDVELLLAIEAIKKTKATYWYALDNKRWDLLATAFTRAAVMDFRGGRDLKPGESHERLPPLAQALAQGDPAVVRGAAAIAAHIRGLVETWGTVHLGAAPIIEVTTADEATAIWPFFDLLDSGATVQTGYGHYHETYRVEDAAWRIESCRITRLRVDGPHPKA